MAKEKRSSIIVDGKTAERLRQAADGVGAPSVGEMLRLASLEPRSVQSAYLDGLALEIQVRRKRFNRGAVEGGATARQPPAEPPAEPARQPSAAPARQPSVASARQPAAPPTGQPPAEPARAGGS